MQRYLKIIFAFLGVLACMPLPEAGATATGPRLALVIGNAAYKTQPLATAVNDAALVSQTLQLAGFDVTGARDLDQNLLRDAFRSFTSKVANAGAGAAVFVYFAGYGLQLAGENYLIPVGTEISDIADIPARTLSLSELMHALSALNPKSTFIVLDAGRPGPFMMAGQAGGLAWTEPEANMLLAFSTAPGTLARDTGGSYGTYARALAEMIGEVGLTPANLFDQVRLRVNELTAGGQVPWDASKIETPFKFFERAPGAERNDAAARTAQFRSQSMRGLGAQNAYMTALLRDTFDAYADFVADYWQDPMAKRVRALLAVRRESITWKRSCEASEAIAYWSYLERYPNGPHAADARRLLARMGAATTPPSKFMRIDYDVPPPLPDELQYIERRTLVLDDPSLEFETPPPIPANFLGPPPREWLDLKPPAASQGHTLPALNLSMLVSNRAPRDGNAPSNLSSGRDEAWVMKPAIDVPAVPQKQSVPSLASRPLPTDRAGDRVKGASPADGSTAQNNSPGTQSGNQAPTNETTTRTASPSSVTSPMPRWLINVVTAEHHDSFPRKPVSNDDVPLAGPSMFAPAAPGLTFEPPLQTTRVWASLQASTSAELPPPSTNGDRSNQNESTASLNSTPWTAPAMPAWLIDVVNARTFQLSPRPSMIGSDMPQSGPSMFSSASAGLTFQIWRYRRSRLRPIVRNSVPIAAHPASPPSPAGLPAQSPTSPISHATGDILRSRPRSATLTPVASASRLKPSVDQLGPPSLAAAPMKPRKKPSTIKPAPPGQMSRDRHEPREAAPPEQ